MAKNPNGYKRKSGLKQGQYKGQGFEGFGQMAETTEHRMEFLYSLYEKGVDIGQEKEALLKKYKYIKHIGQNKEGFVEPITKNQGHVVSNLRQKIVEPTVDFQDKRNREYKKFVSQRNEWHPCPDNIFAPPNDFVKWVDSINSGFRHRVEYAKFNKYCAQAQEWIDERIDIMDFDDEYAQRDFAINEIKRFQENSLYFLDKYGTFKRSSISSKVLSDKYQSHEAHKILAYIFDCGFSFMIGKARQIWFTTTMSLLIIKRSCFHRNHFAKYVCENETKMKEILDDKFKYGFYHLPDWMKPSISNMQERMIKFGFKSDSDKENIGGAESKVLAEVPYITVVNGGAPDVVALDEIGQMPLLGKIIQEGRPTLFGYDEIKGIQVPIRQLCAWGTGGEVNRGGGEFAKEFNDCLTEWKKRNFDYGIVPIFFDAFARAGVTQEMYDTEKAVAYNSPDEDKRIKFHQHYPLSIEDMFLSNKETLLPQAQINNQKQRIYDFKSSNPQFIRHGYFQPVYSNEKLHDTSFIPYKIADVIFVPTDDDDKAAVTIYQDPEPDWIDRYFQGTDPIDSASGMSNFSSSIWDAYENTVSACINTRNTEYRLDYLQAILMNLYYKKPMHLIEINIGKELKNMIENLGYYQTITPHAMLPKYLQINSSEVVGIKKVAANSPQIIGQLVNLLTAYKDNIYIEEFFTQLSTFTRNESKSPSQSTGEIKATYRTENYKYWKDDVIFSTTYAYICAQCYAHRQPREINTDSTKKKQMRIVCNEKTGWQNTPMLI